MLTPTPARRAGIIGGLLSHGIAVVELETPSARRLVQLGASNPCVAVGLDEHGLLVIGRTFGVVCWAVPTTDVVFESTTTSKVMV